MSAMALPFFVAIQNRFGFVWRKDLGLFGKVWFCLESADNQENNYKFIYKNLQKIRIFAPSKRYKDSRKALKTLFRWRSFLD